MNDHLLVVEPDQVLRDILRTHLNKHQFVMSVLLDATRLVRRLTLEMPSAVVLRHDLPDIDGMAALRDIRAAGFDMPVLILSHSTDVADKILAFELGANDYLVDPFDISELLARIRNSLRLYRRNELPNVSQRAPFRFGQHIIDFQSRRLLWQGVDQSVRPSEFTLLEIFSAYPMRVLTRDRLIGMLGRNGSGYSDRGLDVLISRTRSALGAAISGKQYIQTIRGRGYVFVPDNALVTH
jgi:two-component system, OmpR family, phosphate regulon response regulator OmpR